MCDYMGYLVCEKCGGYYSLEEGESPTDFAECRCGGKLEYLDSLNDLDIKSNVNNLVKGKLKEKFVSPIMLRLLGVLLGAVIMYIPYYLLSPDPRSTTFVLNYFNTTIAIWFCGGLLAAFIAGGRIKDGFTNGFCSAFLSGIVVIALYYWLYNNQFTSHSNADNLAFLAALGTVYILYPGIYSVTGGMVGALLRKAL